MHHFFFPCPSTYILMCVHIWLLSVDSNSPISACSSLSSITSLLNSSARSPLYLPYPALLLQTSLSFSDHPLPGYHLRCLALGHPFSLYLSSQQLWWSAQCQACSTYLWKALTYNAFPHCICPVHITFLHITNCSNCSLANGKVGNCAPLSSVVIDC